MNKPKTVRVKNVLKGTSSLHSTRTIKYSNEEQEIKEVDYNLVPIKPEELLQKRLVYKNKAMIIFNINGKLFYTDVPKDIKTMSSDNFGLGCHLCYKCKHASAASNEKGGCAKVRDLFASEDKNDPNRWLMPNVAMLEKYKFITLGFESVATKDEVFVVCECANFEEFGKRTEISREEYERARLSLAQFLFPDIQTIEEVRRKRRPN